MFRFIRALVPVTLMAVSTAGFAEETPLAQESTPASFEVAQAEDAGPQVIEFDIQDTPAGQADFFDQPEFNEFVTLDFKNADIQNVIRLIAARTGLNILLNPEEVSGIITLHLENVRLGHALDEILKNNRLAYIVASGGIVRIVPESRVGRSEVETLAVSAACDKNLAVR